MSFSAIFVEDGPEILAEHENSGLVTLDRGSIARILVNYLDK